MDRQKRLNESKNLTAGMKGRLCEKRVEEQELSWGSMERDRPSADALCSGVCVSE